MLKWLGSEVSGQFSKTALLPKYPMDNLAPMPNCLGVEVPWVQVSVNRLSYMQRWYAYPNTVSHCSTNRPIVWHWELNSRPLSHKSYILTTRLPSHLSISIHNSVALAVFISGSVVHKSCCKMSVLCRLC